MSSYRYEIIKGRVVIKSAKEGFTVLTTAEFYSKLSGSKLNYKLWWSML
jgi:hypothetical protein